MKNISDKIIRYRILIIISFIAITILFAMQISKAKIDPDMKSQLPKNIPSRINTDKIEELFGGTEMVMILVEGDDVLQPNTLKRIKRMSKKINRVSGVDKVLSLFDLKSIKNINNAMVVNPTVKRIPRNIEQIEELRQDIRENDVVYGNVIAKDFSLTALIAVLKTDVSDSYIIHELQNIIKECPGPEKTTIGGLPYVRSKMTYNIQHDMKKLLPIGFIIMTIFLFVCFRQIRGILLPFIVVAMSIMVAMGLIPILGWKIMAITIIVPVFLVAVANDYGIHMIARFQEENDGSKKHTGIQLAKFMFEGLNKPVLLTGLTTIAGMLCLLGHKLISARQVGILAALGILYALCASLFFIPAVISLLPVPKPINLHNKNTKNSILERLLLFLSHAVTKNPKLIIVLSLLITAFCSIGIYYIKIDTDPIGYFPKNHEVVKVTKKIDKYLGGTQNISVVYKGDIKSPRIMHKIDKLEHHLLQLPEVGNTSSIAKVVRQMSKALNSPGDPYYDKIPDNRRAIAQYFELYSMSGDPEDFEKLVDFPYEHSVLTARLNVTSTAILDKLINDIKSKVKGDTDVLLVGGFGTILLDLAKIMVNGQLLSLTLATSVVAIMLMILFRSLYAGLISIIPISLSIIILFGLMGFFNIELNVATALLSSIMIGVGIDYTIHFLWRYKLERKEFEPRKAVERTLITVGRGIVFNALSVIIGFVALLFSNFLPVQFFGFLVVVCISSCLMGALVLIPALCIMFRPKFLEPGY